MNNIWFVMIAGGLITFGMRFSLIYLFGKFEIPNTMRRAMRRVQNLHDELLVQWGPQRGRIARNEA